MLLTILGILVSGFGLYYAIMQVKGLKDITEKYQEQVKEEVATAQEKIRDGLLISEVTLCLKNLESAIKYIQEGKIELAMLRMEDIEVTSGRHQYRCKDLNLFAHSRRVLRMPRQ